MSKVIIGIHGLGNKPPKETLEEWWLLSMREGLKSIGKFIFPAKFKIVYWADVLYKNPLDPICTDKKSPLYLEEKYTPASVNFKPKAHKIRRKILDIIEKKVDKIFLNDNHSATYDYITDIIIHKYFRDFETYYSQENDNKSSSEHAREVIRKRVLVLLNKYKRDDIFLIGHSMGSIVAYNVLTLYKPHLIINTFVTVGSPLGFPVVMKRIAREQKIEINETNKLKTPPGVVRSWYNFSDLEDKVAMNYNLGDDYESNANGISATDIIVNNNYTIGKISNPHKAYGYLRTPEFASILYDFFTYDKSGATMWLLNSFNKVLKRIHKFSAATK
jgi:hypothetical protein